MKLDGNAARAARVAARREPIDYLLGEDTFTFRPEMPLDVLFGVERVYASSLRGLRMWMLAHLLVDSPCDTECADAEEPTVCDAQRAFRDRLRKIRVDGASLAEADLDEMWDRVREALDVTEGESSSSAGSSETAGDTSSETSDTPTTPRSSSKKAKAESAA